MKNMYVKEANKKKKNKDKLKSIYHKNYRIYMEKIV